MQRTLEAWTGREVGVSQRPRAGFLEEEEEDGVGAEHYLDSWGKAAMELLRR